MIDERVRDAALAAPLDAVVPVWQSVRSDTETPVSAFLKLRRGGMAFLLESAEQDGRLGRYSFIGVGPDAVLRADADRGTVSGEAGTVAYRGDPVGAVRRLAGAAGVWRGSPGSEAAGVYAELPGFVGGLVGAFGYDLVRTLERLPSAAHDESAFPVALFARFHTVLAFDHRRSTLLAISLLPPVADAAGRRDDLRRAEARIEGVFDALRRGAAPFGATGDRRGGAGAGAGAGAGVPAGEGGAPLARADAIATSSECDPDDATFLHSVRRAVEAIHDGEAIQIVLSRRLSLPFERDPFELYRSLRTVSPAPYMFFLEFPEVALVGSSPEMLLRIEDGAAQLSPIAGTRRRGGDADEDAALEAELAADPKERAEHVMLVDLGRNDLGRVCRIGSIHVPRLMQVERFSHVMHLVSVVTGRLRDDVDALDALAACFPAGTLSGAPKVRAMELIDELETTGRGAYAGAIAHVAPGARELDACITIRTAILRRGRAWVRAGAGIVADSVPERELAETEEKLSAMRRALEAVA
ncbi:MAG TPA: anthranilate synthase component I family protein [Longimicrobiales bacterium]|nr:anthranilate synthase component I family protein [Longimicrobiales bacterium]